MQESPGPMDREIMEFQLQIEEDSSIFAGKSRALS
jgi:hypothetical protein